MDDIFRNAAKSALFAWKQDDSGLDDLVSELWVWYYERPTTQKKFQAMAKFEAQKAARTAALQMLARKSLGDDMFNGRSIYSSENVKDALSGTSTNRYLVDILPMAMEALGKQNADYAEAIRVRYEDGVKPAQGTQAVQLTRAVKSLTEHVNVIAITAGVDADGNVTEGPGSRNSVFPSTRKSQGHGHSDPTADIAIALMENPELRDEYLYEPPLPEFLGGRGYAQSA